jgi:hypothetical protein
MSIKNIKSSKVLTVLGLTTVLLVGANFVAFVDQVRAQYSRNRPDLNGLLIRNPGNGMIFWVDRGKRRLIQSLEVYNKLFVTKDRDYLDTDVVELGPPITEKNRLIGCAEKNSSISDRIYLLDNGTKRHIVSQVAFEHNNFNWSKVIKTDCETLQVIPDGDSIN